jgi:radical SAM protein with 4Fe4S-binding SPASM domain
MSISVPLEQILSAPPESTPLFTRIQIQTVSWCNRSCNFCPSGKFPVPKTFMALEVYHRIIDQLSDLHYDGRISPYLMNESLLDKRLPDLIAYARRRCPESWIAINTNGDALSATLLHRLFDAGLNCLDVNAYDDLAQYERYTELTQRVVAQRQDVSWRTGYLDPLFNGENRSRQEKILHCRDMTDWEGRFAAKQATLGLTNRSGNVPGSRHLAAPLALGCPRPFQQMYINHRGEAVLCCNDWRFEVIMGNTATATLAEIWHNATYQAYRRNLQHHNRAMSLCATCDYKADPTDWD